MEILLMSMLELCKVFADYSLKTPIPNGVYRKCVKKNHALAWRYELALKIQFSK